MSRLGSSQAEIQAGSARLVEFDSFVELLTSRVESQVKNLNFKVLFIKLEYN